MRKACSFTLSITPFKGLWTTKYQHITWKKTEMKAMLYPKRSKEKSPRAAMRTPAAVNITERVT